MAEASYKWPPRSDCRLHRREAERGLMTRGAVPHFGDPEGIGLRGIGRDDVAETTGIAFVPRNRIVARVSRWPGTAVIFPMSPYIGSLVRRMA